MSLTIAVPRETYAGEKRVAAVPEVVEKLLKLGFAVTVESGAGAAANFSDESYQAAGARIAGNAAELMDSADIVFKVRGPTADEIALMKPGTTLVSFIWPAQNPELMQQLAARKLTVLAIDSLPRQLSRAQKMDALTSMASISGYRAVIEAANAFGRFFNGQVTAAGKIPPAKVFVAGAGVAGLAAIGTAANLGAIVRANDTRAEVADQVVSLGGEFVKVDYEEEGSGGGGYAKVMSEGFQQAQREMYAKQAKEADIIITTALIPGKPAPRLITAEMVQSMKPGSVIVDMAGEQGGNCELTVPGEAVVRHGVTIIGYTDLVSRLAKQASTLYSTNLLRVTEELCKTKDGVINVNMDDDAIRGLTVVKDGAITLAAATAQAAGRATAGKARGRCNAGEKIGAWPRRRRTRLGEEPGDHVRRGCAAVLAGRRLRARLVPFALHRLRAGLLRRLHGGVERHACAAYATDERDQRHFQHHRDRRTRPGGAAAWCRDGRPARRADPRPCGRSAHAHRHQHVRRLRRHPSHACDVPEIRGRKHVRQSSLGGLHRRHHPVHPEPRRSLQSGDFAARQLLRHRRHDDCRARDRVRSARHASPATPASSARCSSAAASACTRRRKCR